MQQLNKDVANALQDIAKIKKSKGSNSFSYGAYKKAAVIVENLATSVKELDLQNTKGIGDKIAAHITEFINTGKIQFIQDNLTHLNSEQKIEQLLRIEGIGEKTALKIYQTLNITTIDQLKTAIADNSISQVLKEKGIENIKKGIEYLETTKGRIRLDEGLNIATQIYNLMKPVVTKLEFCGSIRRSKKTVGDIDIAITSNRLDQALTHFTLMPIVDKIIDRGEKKASVWINGVRCDCYIFTDDMFESGIMHLTGSAEHNKRLRMIAISKGYILSQYGIYNRGSDGEKIGNRIDDGTEKGIYKLLDLQWVPPEHREGSLEFDRYQLDNNVEIINKDDIKFDYHTHSTHSDGTSSIEQLVVYAISKGLKGIAVTDHSQSLKIAKGLSIESLKTKYEEILQLRKKYPDFKILHGTECDIKSDGTLDYPDDVLKQFDIVIASIHTNTKQDITELYKSVIRSGKVHIIGHITGRLINERPGHEFNEEAVLQECKLYNVAIELNCQPNRLDANENILKHCKQLGVKIALGSDAHEKHQIDFIKTFGLWISKRAWLTKDHLFNV